MPKKHLVAFAVLSVLASAGPGLAAGAEAMSPLRGTPQEYKACLDIQDDLKLRRLALDEHVSENNNTVALLQVEAKELVEAQKRLVLSDEVQVADFNSLTEEHNRKILAAEKQTERVKVEREAYSNDTLAYNRKCASLVVDLNVRDTVISERSGQAGGVAATASAAASEAR